MGQSLRELAALKALRVLTLQQTEVTDAGIKELAALNQTELSQHCRQRAEMHYDGSKRYLDYLRIYERLLQA